MDSDRANRFVVSSKRGALMRQGASLDAPPREGFDVGAAPAGVAAPVTEAATIPAGTVVAVGELRALASGKVRARLDAPAACAGAWVSASMLKLLPATEAAARWLPSAPRPPLASTTPRVFCFAASGTGPELFEKLAAHCGGRLELACALLPGRHPRHKEDVVGDLGALAAALADYLPLEESLAPFALLGVSIGALVAWALAKDSVLWPRRFSRDLGWETMRNRHHHAW